MPLANLCCLILVIIFAEGESQSCGGILNGTSGYIMTPDSNNIGYYDNNLNCIWTLLAESNQVIQLNFSHFDVEFHEYCFYDFLKIFDGSFSETAVVGIYCNGNEPPSSVTSVSDVMLVQFHSDDSVEHTGFNITYSIIDDPCRVDLSNTEGSLGTFGLDRNSDGWYERGLDCLWNITTENGSVVHLKFLSMDIPVDQNSSLCRDAHIKVYDGSLDEDVLIETLCGAVVPPKITSTSSMLFVSFYSHENSTNLGSGFEAVYSQFDGTSYYDCGETLNDTRGWFSPPADKGNSSYRNNLNCTWSITAGTGSKVQVVFKNIDIETSGTTCEYDYLQLYDGDSTVGTFCNSHPPPNMTTKSDTLHVRFISDSSIRGGGFNATYLMNDGLAEECGRSLVNSTGYIESPDSDNDGQYDHSVDCRWTIVGAENDTIELKMLKFDLEQDDMCSYDYLKVYDGLSEQDALIGVFCGNTSVPRIQSSGPGLVLHFFSDASITGGGFYATYGQSSGTSYDCGGVLSGSRGQFSPSGSERAGFYDNELDCQWTIMAEQDMILHLLFLNIDIESDTTCRYDFIKVYNGEISERSLVGTFCGFLERKKVVSPTVLYVHFHSDASVTKTGFKALYASARALERRRWPPGDYSLPMSKYGCPDPDVNDWKYGYINITIEYPSERSFSDYLMGPFGEKSYQLTFCTMTLSNNPYDQVTAEWPPGSYTIYGGNSGCPAGFNERSWEGRYGGVYRHVANGHFPKVELDWGPNAGGTLPGFGYNVLRIIFTLCDAGFSTDEQIHHYRFPFVVLKSEANLDTNSAMEGISLNPAVRVITNMAHEDFGLHPLIIYLPKELNQSKVTTWALGLPDQKGEDMSWVLYDLGVSVAVTSLRVLNMKTDLNTANVTMLEMPSVLIFEHKWSFFRYGSYHCLQHKTISASRIDVYCLNKPSGRYLVLLSESVEQRELFNKILTRSLEVWINSDKVSPRCHQALGMQDGSIQDFQLSASTEYQDYPAYNGRPGSSGWCTRPDDSNLYIQVDFITPTVVEGFQIFNVLADQVLHENSGYETFIKGLQSFAFSYSTDAQPGSFIEKERYTLDPTLPFNYGHTVLFTEPTLARYWRMRPLTQEWRNRDKSGKKCFNIEIFGCLQIGTKSIHCAERNDSNWFSSRNMWITQYHGPPRTLFNLNTSQECLIACEELSSYCSVITHDREAQTCMWYEESPTYSYMKYSVNSDETLIRLCSDGPNATYQKALLHLFDWDATTTIIDTPGAVVSQGFPFSYFRGELWRWIVSFPNETYANMIVFNLSFDRSDVPTEVDGSAARYSEKSDRLYLATADFDENKVFTDNVIQKEDGIQYIFDRDDNDMFFHYNFNVERLVLILRTTLLQSHRTDHGVGFRLLVYSTDLPPCFPHGICKEESALIYSDSYLGDFVNYFEAIWTIMTSAPHYVTLILESFDVGCETGSSFQVQFTLGSLKKFCNYDKRIGTIASIDLSLTIRFRLNRISGSLIEQFSAVYHTNTQNSVDVSFTEGTVDIPLDVSTVRQATKVCSWQFGKCYILLNNLADFGKSDATSWSHTRSDICKRFGWSMLSLHSKLEQDFIGYLLLQRFHHVNNGFCYIGLERKITPTGDYMFSWLDGSPVTFTAWATGHPSPSLGGCTRLRLAWSEEVVWESIPCYEDLAAVAVCDYYNRTGSAALLTTNIGINLRNSRRLNGSLEIPNHAELSSYFFCDANELISLLGVCNGNRDCLNGEDEADCSENQDTCNTMQFRCGDGRCVTISVLCDYYDDCVDHSDEDCYFPSCEADQFRCDNSKCIDGDRRCDGKIDCNDESDEKNCILDNCNNENSFLCGLSKCLPRVYVCDGMADCPDGRDEENCEKPRTCQQWWDAGYTQSGRYIVYGEEMECDFESIEANNTVITRYYKIDHGRFVSGAVGSTLTYQDTGGLIDMYNENKCYQSIDQLCQPWIQIQFDIDKTITGASNHRCRCVRYIETLTNSNVSSSSTIQDCGSDERSPVDSESFHLTIETSAVFRHIETMRVKLDHSFNTEEMRLLISPITCFSDFQNRGQGIACGNGFTTASDNRCLYSLDQFGHISGCRSLEHLQNCESYVCPPDYFKCPDSFCLETRFVCDGIRQCQRGEDEANCETRICDSLYRCLESSICLPLQYLCDGSHNCPLGDDERLCNFTCPDECVCHGFAADCTGQHTNNNTTIIISPTTRWLDISFNPGAMDLLSLNEQNLQHLVHLNVSNCQISNITDSLLKFMKNLLVLDIRYNNLKIVYSGTFVNQERLRILHLAGNFEILTLEPAAFKGLNSLSEMKLSHLRLGRISRAAFASLQLKTLELSENIIYFMENNAFETLVVENIYLNGSDILSFSHDMFKGIESVDTIASDAFKFCCVRPDFLDEENCYPHKDEFSSCADLMRNEVLRALIWVIGVFALIGNCASLLYRFIYDRKRLKLGYGIFVSNLAVSDFLMGVYLFIIASADVSLRGEYIFNSDSWKNSAWCHLAGVLSALSSEASVLFMCLITLDRILVTKFPFGQIRITPKVAGALVSAVWLIASLISLLPILHTSYFKDEFYSKSGVCLALPLTRDKPPGWAYSVGLFIGFNSVTFLLIAFGQILIYREINASKMKMKNRHSSRTNDLRVARNLLLVVSTDFLCWFPIGILGVLALTDHVIPSDVYAWTAVIILPINSALNPFLYTLSAIISKKKFSPDSSEQTRTEAFTKDDFDHVLHLLWDNGDFVKPCNKSEMVPLKRFLEKKRVDPFTCVAISIACLKRLQTLYDTGLVQQRFEMDDIYMRRNENKRVRVVLSCRPEVLDKHKPAKKNANIEAFGFILSTLIQHCYAEKKPHQGGSKTKCM